MSRRELIALPEKIATSTRDRRPCPNTLTGFTRPAQFDAITALSVMGDGRISTDRVAFDIDVGWTTRPGSDGNCWDTQFLDLSPFVNEGGESLLTSIQMTDASDDCLVWVLNGLAIEGY